MMCADGNHSAASPALSSRSGSVKVAEALYPEGDHQNDSCEAINFKIEDELLDETLFFGLDHLRSADTRWVADHNAPRRQSVLGSLPPAVHAAKLTAMCAAASRDGNAPLLPKYDRANFNHRLRFQVDGWTKSQQTQMQLAL